MRILLLVLLVLVSLSLVRAVEVPPVPVIADGEAFAVLVIPDLKAALVRLDQAMTASKLPVQSGMVADHLGMALGDPGLVGLGVGPILIAAGPGVPIPSWCAIIPVADATALQQLAGGSGLAAEAVPGGFAIGSLVGGIELAKRLAPGLPALAKPVPAGTDVRLLLASDRLAKAYMPMLLGVVQMGMAQSARRSGKPMGPEQQRGQQALMTAMRLMLAQAGPLCVDISSSSAGWRLDLLAAPAPGILADSIKPVADAGADLGARLGAAEHPPMMAMSGRFPTGIYRGMADLLAEARRDPAIASMIEEDLVTALRAFAGAVNGRIAMRQGVPGNPFQQLSVMGVTDAAALRQALATIFGQLGKGAFADLMAASGLRMQLQQAARQVGTVAVDRFTYEVIPEALPPAQVDLMRAMLKPQEFAVAPDILAMGGPPETLDALLAGPAAKPLQLAARKLTGRWDLYIDWDLALQMKYQFEMMHAQMPMMPAMFADLQGGVPMRLAMAFGDGRVRLVQEVPAALVAQIAASAAAAKPAQPKPAQPKNPVF